MTSTLIKTTNMFDLNVSEDVPDFAMLWLPPFLSQAANSEPVVPYSSWTQAGIFISKQGPHDPSSASSSRNHAHDARNRSLVNISQNSTPEAKATRQDERNNRRLAEGGALVRMRVEDCLKIGDEDSDWQEPHGTANEGQFYSDVPPFDRLMTATRDFLYSRSEEFQYHRSRRLYDVMRDAFQLRVDRRGQHWSGDLPSDEMHPENETCCLLRDTEDAVRGFLAMARREAESGWDMGPPLKLCQIVAAFLAYVTHHKVFPEEPLASRFAKASDLARTAPRLLLDTIRVEEILARDRRWNGANWTMWGGQYGSDSRSNLRSRDWPVENVVKGENSSEWEDGGWAIGSGAAKCVPVDRDLIASEMASLLSPIAVDDVHLLQYIPYARRRVIQVLPAPSVQEGPPYLSELVGIVTVPAPWTEAEGWRRMPVNGTKHLEEKVATDEDEASPLEGEVATIEEPSHLTLWIERSAFGDDQTGVSLVGMALRGRWGLFGTKPDMPEQSWWAFRSKDYVLPAIWYQANERD